MVDGADGALRCPTCGKGWSASHAACPDDGALLATQTGAVHIAETMILSGERQPRTTPTDSAAAQEAFSFDTTIDVRSEHEQDGTNQFDPFDSDLGTNQARRPRLEEPAPVRSPGSKSSDPPTVFLRRLDGDHIELPPGSMVGDEYEIDHRLGAGAMGEVYAARHVKLGKRVAIKAISPRLSEDAAAVERFAQEARTLAQMRHPGLVDVLGFGELADGRAYFVMEYLSGESLFDRLERGRLVRDESLDVFDHMARALEAAHAHGVIHRDLKPENTFLAKVTNEQRPIVKLLDFGLAKLAVEVDRRAERTQNGVVLGTAMYLSPEQARGGPDVDGRTDIYALGCIGYEVFLGRHPFQDVRTVAGLIAAHLHEAPPMPRSIEPRIPPELDLMLFAMLAKDPAHRPTLPQIRSVIEGIRGGIAAPSRPPVVQARAPTSFSAPRSNSRKTIVIAALVMFVGIFVGVVIGGSVARGSRSSTDTPVPAAVSDVTDAGAVLTPRQSSVTTQFIDDAPLRPPPPQVRAIRPSAAAGLHSEPSSVRVDVLVDAGSMVVAPPIAATKETEPATIENEAAVKPASGPTTPPPALPKPKEHEDRPKIPVPNRNQTINPFKKPVSR